MQLKQEFEIVKELRGLSGFGWDDIKKIVTATDEVWEAYLAVSNLFFQLLTDIYAI